MKSTDTTMMQRELSPRVLLGNCYPLLPCYPVVELPQSVSELVDVLGRERALFLIGQLPVCYVKPPSKYGASTRAKSKGAKRVILYVPKRLKPDHRLVVILGWNDAQRVVDAFGGEILCPPTLHEVIYRPWRDAAIAALGKTVTPNVLAEWFGVHESTIRQIVQSPQEELPHANDNTTRLGQRTG